MRNFIFPFTLLLLTLNTACVKEEPIASVPQGNTGDNGQPPSGQGDPLAQYAWHLKNLGQKTFSTTSGKIGEDSKIQEVHDLGYFGEGIRIAVSDSGTEISHEDLGFNQLVGEHRDYSRLPSQWHGALPAVSGNNAHGTAVAGIISAVADNGVGSKGVAPLSKFAAFKFLGASGGASALVKNIDQMQGNFDIFNYSYGYGQCFFGSIDPLEIDAFKDGVETLRNHLGAIYVQSAGNDFIGDYQECFDFPESIPFTGNTNHSDDLAIPEKIIVGASNAQGLASSYSTPGSGVWISAAGGEFGTSSPAILTTDISSCTKGYSLASMALNLFNRGSDSLNSKCNYTANMNGTSSAAPVVSGIVALMLNANPDLTWRDVKHILASTADQLDTTGSNTLNHPFGHSYNRTDYPYDFKWTENEAGYNFSNTYGFGRANALQAVLMAISYNFPLGTYTQANLSSPSINLSIPDYATTVQPLTHTLAVSDNLKIESVQVTINIDHDYPHDLGITLKSPSGTVSRLLNYRNNIYAFSFPENKLLLSNAFYMEESQGDWIIEIVDTETGDAGTLKSWSISINGSPL